MTLEQKINLSKNIIEHSVSDHQRIFMSFSGGKDSMVLLDLVHQVKPDIKVIGIDTGYEFPETIEFTDRMVEKYKLDFEYLKPTLMQHRGVMINYGGMAWEEYQKDTEKEFRLPSGDKVKDGQWYCCAHKEPALQNFLNRKEYDAWITGLRADETENRRLTPIFQKGRIAKVNPIIFWTLDDIWAYIKDNKLDYHSKYDEGYKSLGCQPCTEAGFRDGKANQGKFEDVGLSGERPDDAECGIHL